MSINEDEDKNQEDLLPVHATDDENIVADVVGSNSKHRTLENKDTWQHYGDTNKDDKGLYSVLKIVSA